MPSCTPEPAETYALRRTRTMVITTPARIVAKQMESSDLLGRGHRWLTVAVAEWFAGRARPLLPASRIWLSPRRAGRLGESSSASFDCRSVALVWLMSREAGCARFKTSQLTRNAYWGRRLLAGKSNQGFRPTKGRQSRALDEPETEAVPKKWTSSRDVPGARRAPYTNVYRFLRDPGILHYTLVYTDGR